MKLALQSGHAVEETVQSCHFKLDFFFFRVNYWYICIPEICMCKGVRKQLVRRTTENESTIELKFAEAEGTRVIINLRLT